VAVFAAVVVAPFAPVEAPEPAAADEPELAPFAPLPLAATEEPLVAGSLEPPPPPQAASANAAEQTERLMIE